MAVSLGREFGLSIAGSAVAGVRDVTISETADELTFQPYGSRRSYTYTTGYSVQLSFETIDAAWLIVGGTLLESGEQTPVVITAPDGGTAWSFNAVVTSLTDGQPLDGVRTIQTTLRQYFYDGDSPLRAGDTNP